MHNVVAIDGPAASGKSTVAKKVAKGLGWLYVDSGALYRAVAWKVSGEGLDSSDAGAVAALADQTEMTFSVKDGVVSYAIDGVNPGDEIRRKPVNDIVSAVAAVPRVRERVVSWLREMLKLGSLVMEGRDIGTAVFPDARWKFYLNASEEERARRRHQEMEQKGMGEALKEVRRSIQNRDSIDSTRAKDPLKIAAGAFVIDSTGMEADGVASLILGHVLEK